MYLCIDTITEAAGITVINKHSAVYLMLDPQNSSESIISTIDKALKKSKTGLPDLEAVFVIKGPGSFTGLRVGLTVANQFAHQLKIPIIGFLTDEWWLARTGETRVTYLQTLNKDEVYLSVNGANSIEDIQNLKKFSPAKWLGQVSKDHISWLPSDFKELKDLSSVAETWKKVAKNKVDLKMPRQTYALVEPFYGKEAKITKSNRPSIPFPQNSEFSS